MVDKYFILLKNPHYGDYEETSRIQAFMDLFIDKTFELYERLAELGYLFIDLKPQNIVYTPSEDGTIENVQMIDLDKSFLIKNDEIEKFELENRLSLSEEDKIRLRADIMKYLFSAFIICRFFIFLKEKEIHGRWYELINDINPKILNAASLRTLDNRNELLINLLNFLHEQETNNLKGIYDAYYTPFMENYKLEAKYGYLHVYGKMRFHRRK
jgi:hypothetical protein